MVPDAGNERVLTAYLIANFDRCLAEFSQRSPFPLEAFHLHKRTLKLRSQFKNAAAAIDDDQFLGSLRETLRVWLGERGARVRDESSFSLGVRRRKTEIAALEKFTIQTAGTQVFQKLWLLFSSLEVTDNQTKLVAGSKLLHHILPKLVVPIDRAYTAPFLLRCQPYHFQTVSGQAKTCAIAFHAFSTIAKSTSLEKFIGQDGWNTSSTKVIDNAIVGFLAWQMSLA
jgi:hypothetical protein